MKLVNGYIDKKVKVLEKKEKEKEKLVNVMMVVNGVGDDDGVGEDEKGVQK